MFERWVYADEPHGRLVVKAGATLPVALGDKGRTLLGPREPSPGTADEVERRGLRCSEAEEAVDASRLKGGTASGNRRSAEGGHAGRLRGCRGPAPLDNSRAAWVSGLVTGDLE